MSVPIMYLIVNNDLNMSKGKIAAQVGHIVESITEELVKAEIFSSNQTKKKSFLEDYNLWKRVGRAKIVLKANQNEIKELSRLDDARYIIDSGLTQVQPGSMTVIGFLPSNTKIEKFTKFKLL